MLFQTIAQTACSYAVLEWRSELVMEIVMESLPLHENKLILGAHGTLNETWALCVGMRSKVVLFWWQSWGIQNKGSI